MQHVRYSLYQNGVLIYQEDNRLVSVCAEQRLAEIRVKAADAILATGVDWMAARELSGGKPIPQSAKDQCAALRAKSNALEAQVMAAQQAAINDDDKAACDAIEAVVWLD